MIEHRLLTVFLILGLCIIIPGPCGRVVLQLSHENKTEANTDDADDADFHGW